MQCQMLVQAAAAIAEETQDWSVHWLPEWISVAVSSMEPQLLPWWTAAALSLTIEDHDGIQTFSRNVARRSPQQCPKFI